MKKKPVPSNPPATPPRPQWWYGALNMFPFIFFPLLALIVLICALVMPYMTGVYDR